jgi:hypothetical protein
MERQIKAVDEAIMSLIAKDMSLKAKFDILVSIPGIFQVTAFTLPSKCRNWASWMRRPQQPVPVWPP